MTILVWRRLSRPFAGLLAAALPFVAGSGVRADQSIPVPVVVIYPGDLIRDGMLTERPMPDGYAGEAAMVADRAAVVGKTSRRTLLPNVPIPRNAIGEPKLVSVNTMVRVIFVEGGLTISTYASALQGGASGDVIPVRNIETGLTVSGTIQGDGSVRVGERLMTRLAASLALALCLAGNGDFVGPAAASVRIKDIASLEGMRDNQLVGYGLVVGLLGSGDTMRNAPFTEQSVQSMLDKMGVNVRGTPLRNKNVAAVVVTANLPPMIGRGAPLDVTVSALGDATSLMGGTLIMTPLMGGDGQTHAVAQGAVSVSGSASSGQAETYTQGVPTSGRIANGAIVEREAPNTFGAFGALTLDLRNPDFKTAVRVADAINAFTKRRFGLKSAQEQDLRRIALICPAGMNTTRFMSEIGDLTVDPDVPARVIIDEKTGTVVIGQDVQISTVAVTHGSLTVRITETPKVSQPAPLSGGKTVIVPSTKIDSEEPKGQLTILGGTTLRTLVKGLNQIGLKPSGIIAILQAIKSSGALQADLIAQ